MENVLHMSSQGILMVRTDYKTRSKVRVCSKAGYGIMTYRFKKLDHTLDSPYLSWANLDCCGGWSHNESYLYQAVQQGKKPYAGISIWLDPKIPKESALIAVEEKLKEIQENLPDFAIAGFEKKQYRCAHIFICRKGTLSDCYDLDAVFGFYRQLGYDIPKFIRDQVQDYFTQEIAEFFTDPSKFDYASPRGVAGLITTGLLLGYPIESTCSLLNI